MPESQSRGRRKDPPELCRVCGARLYVDRALRPDRLCPQHLREAREACPPVACTPDDIDSGHETRCAECDHEWHKHGPGGCTQLTARIVMSYGEVVEDTGPHVCGCRED